MKKIINPWIEREVLNGNIGSKEAIIMAKIDEAWFNSLRNSSPDVFKDLQLNLFPEPYIGNPKAQIYLLNGNPGFHKEDEFFVGKKYFQDAIKDTLEHKYQNQNCGDFLYLDNDLDNSFKNHPGYIWWTRHLKSLKKANNNKFPKVFNIEFFPYHSENLDNLKKYFKSTIKTSASNWHPDWPSFEYTRFLVEEAIEDKNKIFVVMRLKEYWYQAIPKLKNYDNVIELTNPQSVYITKKNVRFFVEVKARSKSNWEKLINNA